MRISEIAPRHYENVAGVLMTVLQHIDSKVNDGTEIPFDSVVSIMGNLGYPFDYKTFKDVYDNVPEIGNIVSNHNEKTLTIGSEPEIAVDSKDTGNAVDAMAKSATKAAMNK